MVRVVKQRVYTSGRAKRPFVSSLAYVPLSEFSERQLRDLQEELTLTVSVPGKEPGTFEEKIVKNYNTSAFKGYIGLPRHFGITRFDNLEFEDRTVSGNDIPGAFEGIKPIAPRDAQQEAYFARIANICKSQEFTDYIAVAKTGSGKTAAAINAAIETKKPTLIVVHTNRLKETWLGSVAMKNGLRFFCGEDFVEDYVGIIQQDQCNFRNKLVGIALVHSLARRQYPKEFYQHWHSIHFDELHKHMVSAFAHVPMLFPQKVRGGMTATLREDALKKVAEWHFGPVRVTSEQEVLKPNVYICHLPQTLKGRQFNRYSEHTELTSLSQNALRNDVIANIAYRRGYKRDRNVLIIGDRVHQLQDIYSRLRTMGVKWSALGLYTGKVYTGKWKARLYYEGHQRGFLVEDENGQSRFKTRSEAKKAASWYLDKMIIDYESGKGPFPKTEMMPYIREEKFEEDYYELQDAYYKRMEARCSIFLTTYGIFEAGNDIARLDMGIEATPRSDPRQPLGRILRLFEGKEVPEWYSIADEITHVTSEGEEFLESYARSTVLRIERYRQQKAKIIRVRNVLDKFSGK